MKTSVERAAAQVDDEQFFQPLEEDGNSIALLMKHMSGNLESRFTDFLTTDGEKPTRDRDAEFVREAGDTREAIAARWETLSVPRGKSKEFEARMRAGSGK